MTQDCFFYPIAVFNDLINGKIQFILFVTTDCTVCISARSNSKDADLGKCGATELHLSSAQKLLPEITGLPARNL